MSSFHEHQSPSFKKMMKLELLKISSIPHVTSLCHNNSTLLRHKSGQWLYLLHTEIKSYLVHTLNIA